MDIIDRLKARHQTARERGGDMMTYGEGDLLALEAAEEIEKLRQALMPFAINCDFYKPEVPHYEQVQIPMQFLRAARARFKGELPSIETIL